jgi:hypothetical protein
MYARGCKIAMPPDLPRCSMSDVRCYMSDIVTRLIVDLAISKVAGSRAEARLP